MVCVWIKVRAQSVIKNNSLVIRMNLLKRLNNQINLSSVINFINLFQPNCTQTLYRPNHCYNYNACTEYDWDSILQQQQSELFRTVFRQCFLLSTTMPLIVPGITSTGSSWCIANALFVNRQFCSTQNSCYRWKK